MANPQRSFRPPYELLPAAAVFRIAHHLAHGGRLADMAFPYLHFVFHYLILGCLLSPPGSAARRWARFGFLVAISSIMLELAWIAVGPPALTPAAVVFWGMVVCGILHLLFLYFNY